MDAATRARVVQIFSEGDRRRWPVTEPRRAKSLLADYLTDPKDQRARNALVNALDESVPAQLEGAQTAADRTTTLARLTRRLVDDYSMLDEAARWAVETWAAVLGNTVTVVTPTRVVSAPKPPPAAPMVLAPTSWVESSADDPVSQPAPLVSRPPVGPEPTGMLKVAIRDDQGKCTVVPILRDEITIGRKEGNTIRLTERNVSRRHARITRRSDGYVLEDLASYNGIVVNGVRLVEAHRIRHGDVVLIGDYRLDFSREPSTVPASPPAERFTSPGAPLAADIAAFGLGAAGPNVAANPAAQGVPEPIRGFRLVFLAPAGVPAPVTLDRLPVILGRSEAADVPLPFSSLSREHARVFLDGERLMIEDLGSSNGVQVNGEKTLRRALEPGDMVQLGVVEFRIARPMVGAVDDDIMVPGLPSRRAAPTRSGVVIAGGALTLIVAVVGVSLRFFTNNGTSVADAGAVIGVSGVGAGVPPPASTCPGDMALISGGSFLMGSPDGQGEPDEHPQHPVRIGTFCMDRTEVSVAAYRACVTAGGCIEPDEFYSTPGNNNNFCNWGRSGADEHPVNCIDWAQAKRFCEWSGHADGARRLPREAEWEYAARGTANRTYPWGNAAPNGTLTNLCGDECVGYGREHGSLGWVGIARWHDDYGATAPVTAFPAGATPEGLLNMGGNVWEWVEDLDDAYAYAHHNAEGVVAPGGSDTSEVTESHVYRGGGWLDTDASRVRAVNRNGNEPANRGTFVGVRCARGAR